MMIGKKPLQFALLALALLAFAGSVFADTSGRREVTRCDLLSSMTIDEQRVSAAIPEDEIDLLAAEAACRARLAQAPDDRRAQFQLGALLFFSDRAAALDYLQPAANNGYVAAQFLLGMIYQTGWFTEPNASVALHWLTLAAEAGHPDAQTNLGLLALQHVGIDEALMWLQRAADQKSPLGMMVLGNFTFFGFYAAEDREHGAALVREAAKSGLPVSKYYLGTILIEPGWSGYDLAQGIELIQEAARDGYPEAVAWLGHQHIEGALMPKDEKRGFGYFCSAGEFGFQEYYRWYRKRLVCDES